MICLDGAFSHDVRAAILVFQNNETAAIVMKTISSVLINLHSCWSRERKRSFVNIHSF